MDTLFTEAEAYVFDAYGTLFDVASITASAEALVPGRGDALARSWRAKQLEYTWLSSLMERWRPFDQVTAQALDYALASLGVTLPMRDRESLCAGWLDLAPYADARDTLSRLAPCPRWILSNGTPAMLDPLVERSGLGSHLDGVLSVDAVGIYKPSPRVYRLAVERLGLAPERITFVSANAWDAAGAKTFGFRTVWINRGTAPVERQGAAPDRVITSLAALAPHREPVRTGLADTNDNDGTGG